MILSNSLISIISITNLVIHLIYLFAKNGPSTRNGLSVRSVSNVCAFMCAYVRVCVCMCVCMCICMRVCMCAYVRVCVFVCVSMASVYVLVCVPDVFLLCLLR